MKKKLTIWVCEDDESLWEYQEEILKKEFPKARIKFFLNAGYAAQSTGSPDFIIIDVGGISSLGCDIVSLIRYNVEGLSNLHPGAIFIINSALSELAKYIYEELKPECRAVSEWVDGCNMGEVILAVIRKYL